MTSDAPPWQERYDTIRDTLLDKSVRAALRDFQISCNTARALLTAATEEQHANTSSSEPTPLAFGKLLDIGLVIAWSADGIPPTKDPNPFRSAALPSLAHLRTASLQVQDFKSVKILQKSAGSLVEVVKSRLDGRIYVLKSLVKGFARRNAAIQTPINETKLLQRQPLSAAPSLSEVGLQLLTPQLLASFQTQSSVHVLMEYVPSGDFSELLLAASNCDAKYPGRASTGLLTEDWILPYSVDMVQAIAWVHAQGFAHRDIKPGNFLLDRSGHLKLCDFSSAAPFSEFDSTELASVHSALRRSARSKVRKVWAFYCSQPTGTCDYLSPEVLEAEEKRVLERQQQLDMSSLDDILGRRQGLSSSQQDSAKVPERSPGMYGPEVDWWSFGVMLYEMRFGVLPFFASKMEETYEKIKDHTSSLSFDSSVACSASLRNLIQCFLTDADQRLGRGASQEIQQHSFYCVHEIDWSKQWPMAPPFLPNANLTDSQSPSALADGSGGNQDGNVLAARLQDNSLSVVSTVPSFSALYNGNPDDFPAFNDSRDQESDSYRQQQSWWDGEQASEQAQNHAADAAVQDDQGGARADESTASRTPDTSLQSLPRSSSSPAVVVGSTSQSTPRRDSSASNGSAASPHMARCAPRWSDCDATFVGFSYLPPGDAFLPARQGNASPGQMSTAASLENVANELEISPSGWPTSTPVASTPFHRSSGQSSQTLSMLPTPPSFAPSPVGPEPVASGSGQAIGGRNDVNITRPPAVPSSQQHNFVTPARKPSYMAIHDRFRQLQGQEAPIPEDVQATYTPAVPASPYPFPMASVMRTSKFTASKKSVLNRRDLDRARSATPGGGSVGSDSRQSGGSNAIREMSEREAWDAMMAAVQKSVRKKQPPAFVPPTPVARSAGIPRSSTDPQLSASKPISKQPSRQPPMQSKVDGPDSRRSSRRALQALAAPRQAADRTESTGDDVATRHTNARQSSGTLHQHKSTATLIAPRATVKVVAAESPERSPESPRIGAFVAAQYALDIDMYDSDGSDDSLDARRNLKHKKSTCQLLIKAQERGTPTKPKRAQSPPLTEAFASAPSVAAVLEAAGARSSSPLLLSDQSVRSCTSSRDVSYDHGVDLGSASAQKRSMGLHRSEKASQDVGIEVLSSSLGKNSVTFAPMAYVPVLGAIPPWRDHRDGPGSSDGHNDQLGAYRETGWNGKTLRRKDSGEMLSQYRKAKGMGRATSMLSLSDRAKADADNPPSSRPGTASTIAPLDNDGVDDFILGHVESRMRSMVPGGSLPGRTIRRFSSVLSLKVRERVTVERPASQDGAAKTSRGFGRFRSRIASSTLFEEANEEPADGEMKGNLDRRAQFGDSHRNRKTSYTATEDQENRPTTSKFGRRMGATLPRSFGLRNSSALPASQGAFPKRTALYATVEAVQEGDSPGKADVSLMTGLNQRHNALQGSLLGLEQRLARLKARLED